jgi:hypothetical protein
MKVLIFYLQRDYLTLDTVLSRECGSSDIHMKIDLFSGVFHE